MKQSMLKNEILDIISSAREKVTPGFLERKIAEKFSLEKKEIRAAIRSLVQDETLSYTYEYGRNFLEMSFNKPARISKQVVLKPPGRAYRPHPNEVVVDISGGVSFGTGRHPTTRLATRGIESAVSDFRKFNKSQMSSCLDLGTGSGVLVIIAVLLGVQKGVGIDIDPNAMADARENVRLNQLTDKIQIYPQSVEDMTGEFPLVIANLRYTTIINQFSVLSKMSKKNGYLVMSGIKSEEVPNVLAVYSEDQYQKIFFKEEKGWVGLVLRTI